MRVLFQSRPAGVLRLVFRLPVYLYRLRLGWLLGHRGRKSGRIYHAVLEVIRYDLATRESMVLSGWGERADTIKLLSQHPARALQDSEDEKPRPQDKPEQGVAGKPSVREATPIQTEGEVYGE